MKNKIISLITLSISLTLFAHFSVASAADSYKDHNLDYMSACIDYDEDGYFAVFEDTPNYTREELIELWHQDGGTVQESQALNYFTKKNVMFNCKNHQGYKGIERALCDVDYLLIGFDNNTTKGRNHPIAVSPEHANSLYDPKKYEKTTFRGRSFNPGQTDIPGDGIDQDCDGYDSALGSSDAKVSDYVDLIGAILRSVLGGIGGIAVVWSGILYATSAGDENKISKAKKAFFYGVVGIAIGFLSSIIIGMIAGYVA